MNKLFTLISAGLITAAFTLIYPDARAALPPEVNQTQSSLAPMLKGVLPCVVNISVMGEIMPPPNPFAQPNNNRNDNSAEDNNDENSSAIPQNQSQARDEQSGGSAAKRPRKFESLGSGVIVDTANGYILTNAHLLRQATVVNVTLSDGRQRRAKLIGMDPPSDIAVLQIKADKLTAATFANSENLQVGDFVVAIGNPFGLNQTVTSGIVSGLQRTGLGIEGYENFIQTDASINPGNSGGALVNLHGQLVGINTAILAPGGGNIGIGFAIPSNMAKSVMDQLIKFGNVRRGLMGVLIQSLTPTLADAFNAANTTGALVTTVTPHSPAAAAGFKTGDIIQRVNGRNIDSASQVTNIVGLLRVGSKVDLQVMRDGKPVELSVTTASPEDYQRANQTQNPFLFGVNMRNFNENNALYGEVHGVQVVDLSEESPAWRASPTGIRPGDVIVSANMQPVANMDQLRNILKQNPKQLLLNVLRNEGALFIVIK